MKILRIVPNVAAKEIESAKRFYGGILGLHIAMDMGWIATFEAESSMLPQLSVATHGGSATDVPDLTIEVDDLDEALLRLQKANVAIEYGPAPEPWGVRRFFVRDPFGRLLNIMRHLG
jgi:catechol 2,3-dioxygenase-like lactoylglutathione lyase family enzyme